MKSKLFWTILFSVFAFAVMAQMPVATLEHNGVTTVFYGANAFAEAYTSSVSGDAVILSAGSFISPGTIVKGIKVIGAGYRQDSTYIGKSTIISDNTSIQEGASNVHFEGLHFTSNIQCSGNLENVRIKRCRLSSLNINYIANTSLCSVEECIMTNTIYFNGEVQNFVFKQNIFYASSSMVADNVNGAVFENNVFINESNTYFFRSVNACLFRNNIFLKLGTTNYFNYQTSGNSLFNNICTGDSTFFIGSTDVSSNNYFNVSPDNLFVNQLDEKDFSTNNFRLQSAESYIGTDGTQVGLYGTAIPFKENKLPSNPIIKSATVAPQVDENGNLNVSFTIEAQEN